MELFQVKVVCNFHSIDLDVVSSCTCISFQTALGDDEIGLSVIKPKLITLSKMIFY